jgi:hypothetical protein
MVGPTTFRMSNSLVKWAALIGIHAGLEEGAEDFRLHEGPVEVGGVSQDEDFRWGEFDGVDLREEPAMEIRHALIAATTGRRGIVHLAEESAEEVVGISPGVPALVDEAGEDVIRQEMHVLGDEGDEDLEDEALGADLILAALAEGVEEFGQLGSGLSRDFDAVVVEERFPGLRQEEGEGAGPLREVGERDLIDGIEELLVEVVDPELVEVAEDDVGRTVRDDVGPVIEDLVVLALQLLAA